MAEFTSAQQAAIQALDANVAVSAGAGAGKTRVLVERYLNILARDQAACDGILAITFTNKAAKEMKERIRKRASELAAAADGEEGRRWRAVLGELEYAPIGTFHSFCARVLRENPVEAALDPNFAVLDEAETALLTEKALAEVFTAALAEGAPWLDNLLLTYDKALLTAVVPDLYDKIAAAGLLGDELSERLAAPYRQAVDAAAALKEDLAGLCGELIAYKDNLKKTGAQFARVDRLARDWQKVAAAIAAADGSADAATVLRDYLDCLDRRSGDRDIVAAIRETLGRLRQVPCDRAALSLIPDLCRLLTELDAVLAAHKREQRVLTFTDLETRTADLLKGCPGVRQRYLSRIRYIMVDEFQDTNDLQRQIVYLVAGGDAEKLQGRKLFVVGDPKQSIYRFRGADVAVFARVRDDIAARGGEILDLDVNFRSMDSLLTLFNECFAAVMGTAEDAVPFQPLGAFRSECRSVGGAAEFIVVAADGETGDPRKEEAAAVARRIGAMVAGCEPLVDRDAVPRPVSYGDIAVLFRTVTDLDTYAAALQTAGIPYYVVGGRGFYHRQEIIDILNLLQVIDNRGNETALAGVLRSPLFLLSDDALLALKKGGGSLWQGLERHADIAGLPEEQRQAAARAWRVIAGLRDLRGAVGVSRLIRLALDQTGYLNFVLTQFMGQQKYANLLKLAAVADAFESKGAATLGEFLRYVAKLVAGEVHESEAQVESEGGDTVKLMTIHKAKGLEYPVVFIPDLQRRFRDETGPLIFSAEKGLGLKVPGDGGELVAASVYAEVASCEKKLSLLELKRVLYVAFTRAKDYLVLSAAGGKVTVGKDFTALGTWLGWLGKVYSFDNLAALPGRLAVDKAPILVSVGQTLSPPLCPVTGGDTEASVAAGWIEELAGRIAALPPVRPEPVFTVSAIGKFRQCPRSFFYGFIAALPEPAVEAPFRADPARPPGRIIGDVLHRSLELADPRLPADEWLARAAAEKAPIRWRQAAMAEVRPLLARYTASDLFREIAACSVRREWQFAFRLPDHDGRESYPFTGRVDCLLDYRDGSFGIVDYKTDRVTAREAHDKAEEYAPQLALYAMAAEAAGQGTVRNARLHFLRPGVTVAVPVDEASRAAAAAALAVACRHISGGEREEDYPADTSWCLRCGYRVLCSACLPE
ncbi:UvrD-helicase domain-containing protein [Anaeroselena agilis]|uniref:DNA 3'-5' helicase n=1 Tax=Anaeroselena agilis TaxID=3063788 RepID=A0ABU3NWJ1_9FIRM|nr:UvrD-helicase domain-containing protein [Selenomonadales bacterium 4137-cl]